MKRKLDFITNSSSVCFVGWGVKLDITNLSDDFILKLYNHAISKDIKITLEEFKNTDSYDWEWIISSYVGTDGLSASYCYIFDEIYIGIELKDIPDDQTIGDAKRETKEKLEKLGLSEFKFIEESWRDG